MQDTDPIKQVFEQLDKWRHLPAYRLEPRADVFFALFLPEVLGQHFRIKVNRCLVPEFPIKRADDNMSYKADFLAVQESEDGQGAKRAFLVELKTDMASRRKDQDKYLRDAERDGLKTLIQRIIDICLATSEKPKYLHLLKLLSCLELVDYDDSLYPVRKGYTEILNEMKNKVEQKEDWPSLEVVYVQPNVEHTIDFKKFSAIIEKGGPEGMRHTFACYLRQWASDDAGSPKPNG